MILIYYLLFQRVLSWVFQYKTVVLIVLFSLSHSPQIFFNLTIFGRGKNQNYIKKSPRGHSCCILACQVKQQKSYSICIYVIITQISYNHFVWMLLNMCCKGGTCRPTEGISWVNVILNIHRMTKSSPRAALWNDTNSYVFFLTRNHLICIIIIRISVLVPLPFALCCWCKQT